MAVLGMRIKVWLVVVVMAVAALGAGALLNQYGQNSGNSTISVENLSHKAGHQTPPGCSKGKGYANSGGKKCWKHNGGQKPGKGNNGNGNGKGKAKGKNK